MKTSNKVWARRAKRQFISELIAVLGFFLLNFLFNAEAEIFKELEWKTDAENYHLGEESKNAELWKIYNEITDVRKEVNSYIKHEEKYDACLDEICGNPVGFTTLRIMIAKMKYKEKSHTENKPQHIEIKDDNRKCCFDPREKGIILMHDNSFDENDKRKNASCSIAEDNNLIPIKPSKVEVLFHELCHAFHLISGTVKKNVKDLENLYEGDSTGITLWTCKNEKKKRNSEDLYTITGYDNGNYDPVNSDIFDAYNAVAEGRPIQPRASHLTYNDSKELLEKNPSNKVMEITKLIIDYVKKYFS